MSRLMAAVYDRVTQASEDAGVAEWRRDLLASLTGDVLEIGAGTGHNVPHYPGMLRRLVLAEPDRFMRAKLATALEEHVLPFPVEVVADAAGSLGFPDESFDAVVVTLVLCSVPDVDAALAEIRRVLRPDGRLVFLEHVAADDRPDRLKWQRRLEPVWKRLFGGCHLTRHSDRAIAEAGFEIEHLQRASMRKAAPVVRPSVRGVAVRSSLVSVLALGLALVLGATAAVAQSTTSTTEAPRVVGEPLAEWVVVASGVGLLVAILVGGLLVRRRTLDRAPH